MRKFEYFGIYSSKRVNMEQIIYHPSSKLRQKLHCNIKYKITVAMHLSVMFKGTFSVALLKSGLWDFLQTPVGVAISRCQGAWSWLLLRHRAPEHRFVCVTTHSFDPATK